MPASCRSGRRATAGWPSSRPTIRPRWCSTPRSAGRSACPTSWIRASSARACRETSCATGSSAPTLVICNDYEFELIRQKTGHGRGGRPRARPARSSSRAGSTGARSTTARGRTDVPAVPPHRIVDPTGVGDAFRGGFMKGMAVGDELSCAARRLGSVAATYALEHLGGQSHAYTREEFHDRLEQHFGRDRSVGLGKSDRDASRRSAAAPAVSPRFSERHHRNSACTSRPTA